MHSLIGTVSHLAYMSLQHLCQLDALCKVSVLYKLKHDIAFRRVGIEAHVMLFIVFLEQNDGVLTFCHFQVGLLGVRASVAERVCLESSHRVVALESVGMYGYEEVCLLAVGYFGAFVQGDKHVSLACIHHSNVGAITLHVASECECHIQVYVFFLRKAARCSGVFSTVSGVDAECELAVSAGCYRHERYDEYY